MGVPSKFNCNPHHERRAEWGYLEGLTELYKDEFKEILKSHSSCHRGIFLVPSPVIIGVANRTVEEAE